MFNYFFGSSGNSNKDKPVIIKDNKSLNKKEMFVVLNKNNYNPIGIYDNIEQAITHGEIKTHYDCVIYKFNVNDKPTYLNDPVYENTY